MSTTDALVRDLVLDLEPVRRLRGAGRRTVVWGGLALVLVTLGTWVLGLRPDLFQRLADPAYLAETGALLFVFATASTSAFQLGVPGSDGGWTQRARPVAGLLAWALLVGVRHAGESSAARPLALQGLWCVATLVALGLTPALLALVMLRRAAPLQRGWAGWCALVSAGALAMVGVQAVCGKDDAAHVLAFHVVPLVVATVAGAAASLRLLDGKPHGLRSTARA